MRATRFRIFVLCCALFSCPAFACTICAPSQQDNLLTQRLLQADHAVLATSVPGSYQFQPTERVKGDMPKGNVVADESGGGAARIPYSNATLLLVHSADTQSWRVLGPLGRARADWAHQLVTMGPAHALGPNPSAETWAKRLDFFVGDLENPEPLIAQAAYDEISLAPYASLRTLKPRLDVKKLLSWIDTPELTSLRVAMRAARRPLYAMLLGIAGVPTTVATLESKLLSGSRTENQADVAGLFAALLELRGNAGVMWIELNYLGDKQRSDNEIQAAIAALSVHGDDGVRVTKERVVQAYRVLIRKNPARAGLAASDLARWQRWEFDTDYLRLLKSGEPMPFLSSYAAALYLMRSPQPKTRAAYEAWRSNTTLR